MPYYNKYKRKRYYRKKRYYKPSSWAKKSKFAKKVKKVMSYDSEMKFQDSNIYTLNAGLPLAISTTGNLTNLGLLASITQGSNYNQRAGQDIKLQSLQFRYQIYLDTGFPDTTSYVRVIIFQWRQDDSMLTSINQIIYNYELAGYNPTSLYNPSNAGLFRVLYDKSHNLSVDGSNRQVIGTAIIHKMDKNIKFLVGTNTLNSKDLYMITVSDSSTAPHPQMLGCFRIKYTDD